MASQVKEIDDKEGSSSLLSGRNVFSPYYIAVEECPHNQPLFLLPLYENDVVS